MEVLGSIGSIALPWLFGTVLLLALHVRFSRDALAGELAWTLGAGWFVGVLALTLWMRVLAAAGVSFGVGSIAWPVAVAAVALGWFVARAAPARLRETVLGAWAALRGEGLSGWRRALWFALLGWLTLRAALLLIEVASRPTYPWEAWTRWATKARVYCAFGTLAPFADADGWFAAGGTSWFDAGPREAVTVPLLQAWTCIAAGRWDDTLINLSWWASGLALALAIFGALRALGVATLFALVGTWLAASLPLLDAHVALAGYPDLFVAGFVTLAILAGLRWRTTRSFADGAVAAMSLIACALVKSTGAAWVAAMVPGFCVLVAPARGRRIAIALFCAAALMLLVLARTHLTFGGIPLHIEFAPAWNTLSASLFFFDNWHLLAYGIVVAMIFGARQSSSEPLAPLTFMLAGGVALALVVFAFPGFPARLGDVTTVNRTLLVIAPPAVVWLVLMVNAWTQRWSAAPLRAAA